MKLLTVSILLAALLLPGAAWADPQTAAAPSQAAVDRSVPPSLTGQAPDLILPDIAERRLDNGIPVYIAVRSRLPVEEIGFVFPEAVCKNEPPGKNGLAKTTLSLMLQGAGERDSLAFEKSADRLGASIESSDDFDRLTIYAFCLAERLPETVDLAAEAITQPTFSQRELERFQKSFQVSYAWRHTSPYLLSGIAFDRLLYGKDSRYGKHKGGTPKQVAALTRQDVIDYHAKYFTPDKMFICCCGSVDPDTVTEVLNKRLGRWQPGRGAEDFGSAQAADSVSSPKPEPRFIPAGASESALMEGRIFIVDRPGSQQSNICLGCSGITALDPDRLAVKAMNSVLGGPFSSRLNQNLRERGGFTYYAGSDFNMWADHGDFKASAAVQTDKTVTAVREMLKEIASMHQPVPEDELQRILNYLAYKFPWKFSVNRDMITYMSDRIIYNYPRDYADTYVAKTLKLTQADIKKAADRTLDADKMILVIVGDAKALEPQFKEAGWRAQVLTVDDIMEP